MTEDTMTNRGSNRSKRGRVCISSYGVTLWLSAAETYRWSRGDGPRGNGSWPCSFLANRRLVAVFDSGGLADMSIDGGRGNQDCPGSEFNAITSDYLAGVLPKSHPAYFAAVGQFIK